MANAYVKKYVVREVVVTTKTTDIPEVVNITMDADVFVALYSHWHHSFGGWDGANGVRERVGDTMQQAWDAIFPGKTYSTVVGKTYSTVVGGDDATDRALRIIEEVLR